MNTPELRVALEAIFLRPVAALRRERSPYSSSFPIEELEVTFHNGETVTMIFKNLGRDAMLESARTVRPDFLYAPEREIEVYRSLLSSIDLGAPKLYGATVMPALAHYGLFLEKVSGQELCEIGEFDIWLNVARWLAQFHRSFDLEAARTTAPLLVEYDAAYCWRWLHRAHEAAGSVLDRIAGRYDRVVDILLKAPQAFIHGEFYASNILVQGKGSAIRVCPVDWEMAAIGPALLDVAALASGKWSRDERLRLLQAYHSIPSSRLQSNEAVTAFDCCQLQVALQWVGWSRTWTPSPPHAHDWLTEVLRISASESLAPLFV